MLAELQIPRTEAINERLNELLRPGGERVEISAKYEACDASGTIRVVVDSDRRLSDVDIRHSWATRIPPAQFTSVLFDTYVKAIQRAMVVQLANDGDSRSNHPVADTQPDEIGAKPYEEWIIAMRARISDIDTQLESIRRLEERRAPSAETDVRSPLGFFVLRLQGGSPAGLTGSVDILAKAGLDRLRKDFLDVFSATGLTAPGTLTNSPTRRRARDAGQEDDEEPFEFRYDA
ncbi:hypothetical protein [Amycolatopsis sp. NPDC001319]|uniref:hypothetical protein n=1 Tax=unclassified Amycolatopsis TaxID=2618356 RepID=UPI0036B231D4